MSYQALARKYRPQRFDDMVGQETLVRTLQNAIESGRIHHAYLFSGVRGIGKTTAARILAKALNCQKGPAPEPCNECTICREITEGIDLDVREIDAATYTGVDNVRELREVTQFQPARDRYRIFIIDEAHMLSNASWNALLKILEEPPPHVVFMFATTEMNKVPATILSRVQKFSLRKITLDELITRLQQITSNEAISADREALEIIARRGEGSVRDALSLLDQIIAFSGRSLSAADVGSVLGLSDASFFGRLLEGIAAGNHAGVLEAVQEAADSGRDFKLLYRDFLGFVRGLLLISGGAESLVTAAPEDLTAMRSLAGRLSYSELLRLANLLIRDDDTINKAEHQRLAVEIALLKAATFPRLRAVEEEIAGTAPVRAGSAPVRTPAAPRPPREPISRGERGDLAALQERVQKSKPLLASYLTKAQSSRREGNRLIWTFDDPAYVAFVSDSKETIEQIASEVFGEPMKVEAVATGTADSPAPARRAEDASPLREDPVIKSFQKHLGADIVPSKSKG